MSCCKIAVSIAIFALVSVVALYSLHTYTQFYNFDGNNDSNDGDLLTSSSKHDSKNCFFKKGHQIKIKDVTIKSDVPSEVICLADESISLNIDGQRFLDFQGKGRDVSFTLGGAKATSVKLLDCKSKKKLPWWWSWLKPVCQKCSQAQVTFPQIKKADHLIQSVSLVAKNPKPCGGTASYPITVINPQKLNFSPSLTSSVFCTNKGPYQLDVVGTGFLWIKDKYSERKPEVFWMDETTPTPITMDESSCTDISEVKGVVVFLCTHFTATVSNIDVPPPNPQVTIVNTVPCKSAVTHSVTVSTGGPVNILAVSPSLIQNDITVQITIIISELPADQTITHVNFKRGDQIVSIVPDPMTINSRVPVTIARNLLPVGIWDVAVVASGDAQGCHTTLPAGLNVVAPDLLDSIGEAN